MTTNIASSDAAMDICSSPNGVSVDASPPTGSCSARQILLGHVRAVRGTGLGAGHTSVLAREVLMRGESCLGAQSAEVLRAVYDGQHLT